MACKPEVLKHVPLFALLDEDETAVLAGQVELRNFAPRQRIYKIGDPGGLAYVMLSGRVRVTTVDQDHQEVLIDEPTHGEFFGFASMLAAIQAPVIMMSQNRQDTKDRLRGELDYQVNRRSESEIQGLARKLNSLGDKIGDVEDLLREKQSGDGA